MKEIDEIKQRAEKATKGGWFWKSNRDIGKGTFDLLSREQGPLDFGILGDADFEGSRFGAVVSVQAMANQDFITHARQDIPRLCDALDIAIEALQDIGNECFGNPALSRIRLILKGEQE